MIAHLPVFFVLVPLVAAVALPLLCKNLPETGWAVTFSVCAMDLFLSLMLLSLVWSDGPMTYRLAGWEPPWGIEYRIDLFGAFVLTVVSAMTVLITLYGRTSVEKEVPGEKRSYYHALLLLHIAGLNGTVVTGDLFNLYVFLEITALSGYALIASSRMPKANLASFKYLMLGTIGITFYLLGVGYLYLLTGTLNMADLAERLAPLYDNPAVRAAFVFITLGLAIKFAVFPFHTWKPAAYGEAPSAISALLASTGPKVAAYALIRVLFSVYTPDFDYHLIPFRPVAMTAALVTMLAGSFMALAQTDIKRMLACSGIGQIGYILLGLAIGTEQGVQGSLIHILNHAMMKGTLFLAVGSVAYRYDTTTASHYVGMGRTMPFTAFAFTVAACSMAGVPGTVGFVSKWTLAMASLDAGYGFAVPFIVLSTLMSSVYFWRIIHRMYFEGDVVQRDNEAPAGLFLPTCAASALCLLLGLGAFVPLQIAGRTASMLLGGG